MDPRWRAAVEASAAWYDDVFALHAIPTEAGDGLWRSLGPPPRWHSAVKTLEPGVPVERVLDAMAPHPRGGIADSFGDLPLDGLAFDLLIDARWLHRPADVDPPTTLPAGCRS